MIATYSFVRSQVQTVARPCPSPRSTRTGISWLFITAEALGQDTYFLLRPPPPKSGFSAAARVFGKVAVLPGGCLGLSPTTAVAWPNGTTALPEGDGVKLSDGQVLRVGDTLDSGGGFANVAFTGKAAGCPGSDVAFVNDPSN